MSNDALKSLQIEPLSDEALEVAAGGKSSDGDNCCSCRKCSNGSNELDPGGGTGGGTGGGDGNE